MAFADVKSVGKSSTFKGDEEAWNEWAFTVKAYLVMANMIAAADLDRCGNARREVSMASASDEERTIANNLYYFLALQTKGAASRLGGSATSAMRSATAPSPWACCNVSLLSSLAMRSDRGLIACRDSTCW